MSNYEKITCRVAIQVCIGHFLDGRERHRTFSMRGVDPDASPEAIAAVVRALAPVLAYPITKVRKIVKRVIVIFEEGVRPDEKDAARVFEKGRVIPVRRWSGGFAKRGRRVPIKAGLRRKGVP